MNEPWFVAGPLQSRGEGFKTLQDRIALYKQRIGAMQNIPEIAKQISANASAKLPSGSGKAKELFTSPVFVETLLKNRNYLGRITNAEVHLSQRFANALARSMRLTHTKEGFGRMDTLGITPIEQKNLSKEFDVLFQEIMGDLSDNAAWQSIEDVDVYDDTGIYSVPARYSSLDFKSEDVRMKGIDDARKLGLLYVLALNKGKATEDMRKEIRKRVTYIYNPLVTQKKEELEECVKPINGKDIDEINRQKAQNLYESLKIEKKASYDEKAHQELINILKVVGETDPLVPQTLKTVFPKTRTPFPFPDDYQIPSDFEELRRIAAHAFDPYFYRALWEEFFKK